MVIETGAVPELSVVIPCRNSSETIADQLAALAEQDWSGDWEVIVADNGSTDDTVAVAETFKGRLPALKVVSAPGRLGAAHARNVGARHSVGRSIVFCDADDVVGAGWLAATATALRDSPFVASRFEFCKLNPEWLAASRGDAQNGGLQVLDYPPYLPHSGASGLGIRRETFVDVGGFDETLRFVQDTDLCIRVQLAGTPLSFAHDALVHIRLPRSGRRQFWQAYRWAKVNALLYQRHRPAQHRLYHPWRNYFVEVGRLFKRAGRLRKPYGRARWLFRAGWSLGLGAAAFKHRAPPMVYSALRSREASGHPLVASDSARGASG